MTRTRPINLLRNAVSLIAMLSIHMALAQQPGYPAAAPQTADANALPAWNPQPGSVPYVNIPTGPTQPMPASRPASWPGTPLETNPPNNALPSSVPQIASLPSIVPPPAQPNPNALGSPPNAGPQPVDPNAAAGAPQPSLDMQSLQVLPGPRQDFDDGRVVATVGSVPILAGDVHGMINQAIHNKMIPEPPPGEEEMLYRAAMRPC